MVKKINHEQFVQVLRILYESPDREGKKIPAICYGTFGIGKSYGVKHVGRILSVERKRQYVYWSNLSKEEKLAILNENKVKDYFFLIDIRLSEYDPSDMRGLPDFDKLRNWIEWKNPLFVEILQHPDSDGILFFDEINMAAELTLKSCYKILHDKIINDLKINYNWLIVSAGNLETDRANTQELQAPLRDRLCEFELITPSTKEWIKWAIKYGIHAKIIAYHTWKGNMLRKVNFDDGQKFTTERGWERVDCIMNRSIDEIDLMCGTLIGEGVATEFVNFLKIENEINLDEIIKNPEKIKVITDAGKKYFVISGLSEKYGSNTMTFEKLFEISTALDESKSGDFVALLWRFCSRTNKPKFRKEFTTKELKHPLRNKFLKYLED